MLHCPVLPCQAFAEMLHHTPVQSFAAKDLFISID